MEKIKLFEEGHYSIWRFSGIPEDALKFLDSIAWGNEGAVYEHKNTEAHIRLLHRPMLIAIYENDKIQGTAVFCNATVLSGATEFNCYYIRYFAASREIKGKGVMKHFSVKVMEVVRENENKKTIYFACIEKGNRGSYKVVENAGYKNIGIVKTNGFSRFFPKASKRIERLTTEAHRNKMLQLLRKQYEGHALVQFNSIFLHDDYFVIWDDGELAAGCQVHRAHWVINRMSGFAGKMIINIIPRIPLLNDLFNPKKFEFLAFEGIYCKPGYESRLTELFEGLLAKEKLKSAMFWMGEKCPVRKRILEKVHTGLIHSFVKDSDVYILASFYDLNEKEISDISSRPLFASAFDYI